MPTISFGDGKTSLRGGFGVFFQTISEINYAGLGQLPFSLQVVTSKTPNMVAPYGAAGSPFPFVFSPKAPRFANNATTNGVPLGTSAPYVYEYNLTVERQLNKTFAFRIGYAGNATHDNIISIDTNSPVYLLARPPTRTASTAVVPIEPYLIVVLPFVPRRRYLHLRRLRRQRRPRSHRRRTVRCDKPALSPAQRKLQQPADKPARPHRQKVQHACQLRLVESAGQRRPHRRQHGPLQELWSGESTSANASPSPTPIVFDDAKFLGWVGRDVLGGWRVNGITILQSGTPFTVTSGTDTNLDGTNNDRANVTGDPYNHSSNRHDKIYKGILNTAAFSVRRPQPIPTELEPQQILRTRQRRHQPLALQRDSPSRSNCKFQFRAESFNIFGNVNLNNPRTNYSVFATLAAGQQYITGAGTHAVCSLPRS